MIFVTEEKENSSENLVYQLCSINQMLIMSMLLKRKPIVHHLSCDVHFQRILGKWSCSGYRITWQCSWT